MPTAPEGLGYRQLGTMEHNICDVLAHRMKGRKMSWSIDGADNLSKILEIDYLVPWIKSMNMHIIKEKILVN